MNIKDAVKKFKLLFDWTPVSVTEPMELYQEYKDTGRMFMGYQVTVTYKHHGVVDYMFSADEHKFFLFPRQWALKRATKFSNMVKKQLQNHRAREMVSQR